MITHINLSNSILQLYFIYKWEKYESSNRQFTVNNIKLLKIPGGLDGKNYKLYLRHYGYVNTETVLYVVKMRMDLMENDIWLHI